MAAFAQVSINADNSPADNSAMLDVKSTSKGMLVPRMTIAQRNLISSPANGLLVFCTDNNQYYTNKGIPAAPNWVMVGSQWITNGSKIYYLDGNVGIGAINPLLKLQVGGKIAAEYGSATSPSFVFNNGLELTGFSSPDFATISMVTNAIERVRITDTGSVGIGTSTPNNAALVDLASDTRGFLPPRMTTTQMNSIINPPAGLMVYNTTINSMCWHDGTSWVIGTNKDGKSCGTVTVGGMTYTSVIIGLQCWMRENLNIGTAILGNEPQSNNPTIEKYCYDNYAPNCDSYGGLYQWNELMNYTSSGNGNPSQRQGICPPGWHLPSDAEWCQMEYYLDVVISCSATGWRGKNAGGKMKREGIDWWVFPNTGATNSSGFTAYPGGYRDLDGIFTNLTHTTHFWTSEENTPTGSWSRYLSYDKAEAGRDISDKNYGFSARCAKD